MGLWMSCYGAGLGLGVPLWGRGSRYGAGLGSLFGVGIWLWGWSGGPAMGLRWGPAMGLGVSAPHLWGADVPPPFAVLNVFAIAALSLERRLATVRPQPHTYGAASKPCTYGAAPQPHTYGVAPQPHAYGAEPK